MIKENTNLFCPITDFDLLLYKLPIRGHLLWRWNRPLFEVVHTPLVVLPEREKGSSPAAGVIQPGVHLTLSSASWCQDWPATGGAAVSEEWDDEDETSTYRQELEVISLLQNRSLELVLVHLSQRRTWRYSTFGVTAQNTIAEKC